MVLSFWDDSDGTGKLLARVRCREFAGESGACFSISKLEDCHLWGLEFQTGEPDEDDWTADVVFNIDYIAEWLCGADRLTRFRVAPARLTFHGVTDLRVAVDWGHSGFQVVPSQVFIQRIKREPVVDQKVYLDRPYYHWVVEFSTLTKGSIEFGAVGFTQTLLAEPVVLERQHLTLRERNRLTGR
jgi:hypothetical protein